MTTRLLTCEQAIPLLAQKLQFSKPYWEDDSAECERFAKALLEWFNAREVTRSDLSLLKRVALAGFTFWSCPTCGELVCEGGEAVEEVDPEWGRFQGVHENDRCSYPGDGAADLRCNHCRCFNVGGRRIPSRSDYCDC